MYCLIPEYQSPFLMSSAVESSCRCKAASRVSTGVAEGVATGVGVFSTTAGVGVATAVAVGFGEGVVGVVLVGLGEGVLNVVLVGLGVIWPNGVGCEFVPLCEAKRQTKMPPSARIPIRISASAVIKKIPVFDT